MEQDATTHRARTDALLVVRCQLGERAAFDDLVRRWSEPLHRYALRLAQDPEVARDITQEVWLRVLQGLGRLHDSANFRAWMFGIAHRTFADRLRIRYAIPIDRGADLQDVAAAEPAGEDEALGRALASGLERLPIVEREVLTLYYLEELSLAEIAAALRIPVGTVKSRLFRARTLLRQQFPIEGTAP